MLLREKKYRQLGMNLLPFGNDKTMQWTNFQVYICMSQLDLLKSKSFWEGRLDIELWLKNYRWEHVD